LYRRRRRRKKAKWFVFANSGDKKGPDALIPPCPILRRSKLLAAKGEKNAGRGNTDGKMADMQKHVATLARSAVVL
jgi:hypothetical protein